MWDFILVLGQIPGTNIQVTFSEFIVMLIIAWLAWRARRKHIGVRRFMKSTLYFAGHWQQYLRNKKGSQLKLSV